MKITQTISLPKYEFDCAARGAECMFIAYARRLNSEVNAPAIPWGLKIYPQALTACRARKHQLKFFDQNLAPAVGELVRVKFRHMKTTFYAYFTEQIVGKEAAHYIPHAFESIDQFPANYYSTIHRLKKLGYTDTDEHHHNIMFCNRRLRWLAVDFGEYSSVNKSTTSKEESS